MYKIIPKVADCQNSKTFGYTIFHFASEIRGSSDEANVFSTTHWSVELLRR